MRRLENSSNSSFVRGRNLETSLAPSPFVAESLVEEMRSCAVSRSAANSAALSRSLRSLGSSSTSDKSSPSSCPISVTSSLGSIPFVLPFQQLLHAHVLPFLQSLVLHSSLVWEGEPQPLVWAFHLLTRHPIHPARY